MFRAGERLVEALGPGRGCPRTLRVGISAAVARVDRRLPDAALRDRRTPCPASGPADSGRAASRPARRGVDLVLTESAARERHARARVRRRWPHVAGRGRAAPSSPPRTGTTSRSYTTGPGSSSRWAVDAFLDEHGSSRGLPARRTTRCSWSRRPPAAASSRSCRARWRATRSRRAARVLATVEPAGSRSTRSTRTASARAGPARGGILIEHASRPLRANRAARRP